MTTDDLNWLTFLFRLWVFYLDLYYLLPLPMDYLPWLLLFCLPLTVSCLIPGSYLLEFYPLSCSWVLVLAYCLSCWNGDWPFCPDFWFLPVLVLSMGSLSIHLPCYTDPSQLILPKWPKPFLKHCCDRYTPSHGKMPFGSLFQKILREFYVLPLMAHTKQVCGHIYCLTTSEKWISALETGSLDCGGGTKNSSEWLGKSIHILPPK